MAGGEEELELGGGADRRGNGDICNNVSNKNKEKRSWLKKNPWKEQVGILYSYLSQSTFNCMVWILQVKKLSTKRENKHGASTHHLWSCLPLCECIHTSYIQWCQSLIICCNLHQYNGWNLWILACGTKK